MENTRKVRWRTRGHAGRHSGCSAGPDGLEEGETIASEEMKRIAALYREQVVIDPAAPIEEIRRRAEEVHAAFLIPNDVKGVDETIGGRPARRVRTPAARTDRVLLYFHGGGYILGSLDTHYELMGRLSRACKTEVIGIDYRLAPEHPYPAALEDAVAAYDALLASGLPSSRIVIGGDSAGGGLTAACLQALARSGKPRPAGAVLFSPWTDLTASGESYRTNAAVDPISAEMLSAMATHYIADTPATEAGVSPLFGNFAGLPPLLIQVGGDEILLDDSTRFAANAREAGSRSGSKSSRVPFTFSRGCQ